MASRITNNIMIRNYMGNLRTNLGSLSRSNDKLSTQRSFNKASQNVTGAAKALRVRKLLNDNARYADSAASLAKKQDTADSALRSLSGIYDDITHLVMQGSTDTVNESDRAVIANQIDKLRDEALSIANTKFGSEYVFCSAGNADNSAPFSVNADGKLCFNGNTTPVDELVKDSNGNAAVDNGDGTTTEILYNGTNYIDVGLGLSSTGSGGSITVDSKSVIRASFSGVDIFGYGTDSNGLPTNFYGLFSRISADLTSGNTEGLITDMDSLSKSHDNVLMSISELGGDMNFLSDISEQLADDEVSLKELQNDVEAVDLAEEIMFNSQYEMAWTVTLQLGGNLLPKSIFDFLG